MLYREIIAVCSEIHTKHINTLCGQNVEFVNVKLAIHISDHRALEDQKLFSKAVLMKSSLCICMEDCGREWM
jgi:hypothetical protein